MNSVMGMTAGAPAGMAVPFAGGGAAAPSEPPSVDQTMNQLQASGFHVIVNEVSPGPLAGGRRPGHRGDQQDGLRRCDLLIRARS